MSSVNAKPGVFLRLISLIVRAFWLVFGNLFLLACTIHIFTGRERWVSSFDLVFIGLVLALIAIRYVDIKWLRGKTLDGQPTTFNTWKEYVRRLLGIAAYMWVASHVAAYFFAPYHR